MNRPQLLTGRAAYASTTAAKAQLLSSTAPTLDWNAKLGAPLPGSTFTRSGNAWYFDATGTLQVAGSNVPRFDHSLTSFVPGSNYIVNSTNVGAVAGAIGSGGALPTGWSLSAAGLATTVSIVGNALQLQISGTSTGTSYVVVPNTSVGGVGNKMFPNIPFTASVQSAVVAGSLTNITSSQLALNTDYGVITAALNTSSTLARTVANYGPSLADAGGPAFVLNFSAGAAINVTFQLQGFQWEPGTVANAYVPTSGAAIQAPNAPLGILIEQASTNLISNNTSFSAGSVTVTNGQTYTLSMYGTGSIAYSGAASGTLTGTGPNSRVSVTITASSTSLTLTPSGTVTYAQLENLAFATSPIPTSGAAVTRNADNLGAITLPGNGGTSSGAIVIEHSPEVIASGATGESYYRYAGLFDPTFNSSEISVDAQNSGSLAMSSTISKNGSLGLFAVGGPANQTIGTRKDGVSWTPTLLNYAGNGVAATTPVAITTSLPAVPIFQIYGPAIYQLQPSGWVSRVRLWNRPISASELAGHTRL